MTNTCKDRRAVGKCEKGTRAASFSGARRDVSRKEDDIVEGATLEVLSEKDRRQLSTLRHVKMQVEVGVDVHVDWM